MKGLLQRFTQWFNRAHTRTGTLWEDRFKSVIVEDGVAARTISAYIDLNPVRAGMLKDPADYRWSSYGEALGGGKKGNGKRAREGGEGGEGLVRAYFCDQGVGFDVGKWEEVSRLYRCLMGLAVGWKPGRAGNQRRSQAAATVTENASPLPRKSADLPTGCAWSISVAATMVLPFFVIPRLCRLCSTRATRNAPNRSRGFLRC